MQLGGALLTIHNELGITGYFFLSGTVMNGLLALTIRGRHDTSAPLLAAGFREAESHRLRSRTDAAQFLDVAVSTLER